MAEAGVGAQEAGASAADVVVTAVEVTKRYGIGGAAVDALRGVSVEFPRGQFATSGKVIIDGVDITTLDDRELTLLRREKIGFVFQFFNLLPMLTAEENIELPLSIAGRRPDRDWERALVQTVGLDDRLRHRPAELSGGQQQHVAIARGLLSRPAVLFADEPTGNLDSTSTTEILGLLRRSVDEYGQTVVMVTHDGHGAAYADRVLFLSDGRIVQDRGRMGADEIYDVVKSLE